MNKEFHTLDLARIYERQGYFQDAFDIYQALSIENEQTDDPARGQLINSGLKRMRLAMENQAEQSLGQPAIGKGIDSLVEQWLLLLMLQKRIHLIKQISSRR
jgi:hypothetical protein